MFQDLQNSASGFFNPSFGMGDSVSVSGGGAGGEGIGGVFDIEGKKVVRCYLVFGRTWIKCDDTELDVLGEDSTPTGVIYAEVDHSSDDISLAVKHAASGNLPDNSLQKSYRALYYARGSGNSSSWVDVRFQPVLFAMN